MEQYEYEGLPPNHPLIPGFRRRFPAYIFWSRRYLRYIQLSKSELYAKLLLVGPAQNTLELWLFIMRKDH